MKWINKAGNKNSYLRKCKQGEEGELGEGGGGGGE